MAMLWECDFIFIENPRSFSDAEIFEDGVEYF